MSTRGQRGYEMYRDLRNYFCRRILTLQLPKQRRRNAKNSFNVDKTCYMSQISSWGLIIIFIDNRHCYFTFIPLRGRRVVGHHLSTICKMIPLPNKEGWLNLQQLTLSLMVHKHRVMSIQYVSIVPANWPGPGMPELPHQQSLFSW